MDLESFLRKFVDGNATKRSKIRTHLEMLEEDLYENVLIYSGGHNLLEPAVYKKPVLYGHYLKSYLEMAEMLETAGGGIRVNNTQDIFEALKKMREMHGNRTI